MITYQLQDRILVPENDKPLQFPNDLTLNVTLSPLEAFGMSSAPSRLAILNHEVHVSLDPTSGRVKTQSIPPLAPFNISYESPNKGLKFSLINNIFHVEAVVETERQLEEYLTEVFCILPLLLNVYFADPPIVLEVVGTLGEANFRVQYREIIYHTKQVDLPELYKDVFRSFLQLRTIRSYPRLTTALQYFHVASRLLVVGNSPWEFMAEVLLQMCKILQVLFGNTRDDVRSGLSSLGYTSDEIERDFMPLMFLRDGFDVAHPGIANPDTAQLQILYKYLARSEVIYRDLLVHVFDSLDNGSFMLPDLGHLKLDEKQQRTFNKIIESIKAVV